MVSHTVNWNFVVAWRNYYWHKMCVVTSRSCAVTDFYG